MCVKQRLVNTWLTPQPTESGTRIRFVRIHNLTEYITLNENYVIFKNVEIQL